MICVDVSCHTSSQLLCNVLVVEGGQGGDFLLLPLDPLNDGSQGGLLNLGCEGIPSPLRCSEG